MWVLWTNYLTVMYPLWRAEVINWHGKLNPVLKFLPRHLRKNLGAQRVRKKSATSERSTATHTRTGSWGFGSASSLKKMSILDVLKSKDGFAKFMQHLTKEFATESLCFYTELMQIKCFYRQKIRFLLSPIGTSSKEHSISSSHKENTHLTLTVAHMPNENSSIRESHFPVIDDSHETKPSPNSSKLEMVMATQINGPKTRARQNTKTQDFLDLEIPANIPQSSILKNSKTLAGSMEALYGTN